MPFVQELSPREVRMNSQMAQMAQMAQMNADVRRFLLYLYLICVNLRSSAASAFHIRSVLKLDWPGRF